MSILVKGMEMPKTCSKCQLYEYDRNIWRDYCLIGGREIPPTVSKPDWCPLVEVPTPHGRLIDASKLFSSMFVQDGQVLHDTNIDGHAHELPYRTVKRYIVNAPTIIEAEK